MICQIIVVVAVVSPALAFTDIEYARDKRAAAAAAAAAMASHHGLRCEC